MQRLYNNNNKTEFRKSPRVLHYPQFVSFSLLDNKIQFFHVHAVFAPTHNSPRARVVFIVTQSEVDKIQIEKFGFVVFMK